MNYTSERLKGKVGIFIGIKNKFNPKIKGKKNISTI